MLQSCGGFVAGLANKEIIAKDAETYANTETAKLTALELSDEQKVSIYEIYLNQITELKENARREKTKEISNKASLNNLRYIWYKTQLEVESELTEAQVKEFREGRYPSYDTESMEKERKKLRKMGYDVE